MKGISQDYFQKVKNFFHFRSGAKHPWLLGISAFLLFLILFLFSALSSLRIFIPYFPDLSGFPFGTRNYLVVFQNNHELRPAGGFISAYGIVKFSHGFFTGLDVADVYGDIDEHPYMEPPYPMEKLLANKSYKGYTFRDANYNPDYPKTAEELIRMLKVTKPQMQIDGVFAVNYSFLENLLGSVGEVSVNGKNFSKDSLFEALEYEVNNIDMHNVEDLKNRKGILKPFASALIKKIIFSPFKLRKVSDTVVSSLGNKEIQLYFNHPNLEKMAVNQGWGGQWAEKPEGDFLAVNEANLGGMKSDRYIDRKVTYHFKTQENPAEGNYDLIGEVTVDLYHYGIQNVPLSGDYTGFFRTYVPAGAKLIDVAADYKKDLWEADENSLHVFGNIVRLKPGEKTQLRYKYSLPLSILDKDHYKIFIPRQSGTSDDYYTVIAELPQGMQISSDNFSARENFGIYEHELYSDLSLDLKMLPDKSPPRVTFQGMDKLGEIVINFNEDVSDAAARDSLNYQIRDLDIKNAEKTDSISIDHIDHSGGGIKLFVKGMTNQPEERYEVILQNMSDIHGNVIEPNPKTITVVQRFGS